MASKTPRLEPPVANLTIAMIIRVIAHAMFRILEMKAKV